MEVTEPFDVELVQVAQGATVVRIRGDLDLATTPQLEETLVDADTGSHLVIDLTGCSFLDSSAVRFLAAAAREAEAAGRQVSLVATDPGVLRVLEITAVDTMLPIHPTLEAAL